ncbi:MAG: hypothetical protein IT242_06320 [Bacteroidia bacterium]|nr:hypothetical protein [Bacteroidia bacterium]
MIKLTQHTLDRIEELLDRTGYKIRNERGNFKSGSCIIESSNIIVLNKFSPVESKVSFLIDAIKSLEINDALLDEKQLNFLNEIRGIPTSNQQQASA